MTCTYHVRDHYTSQTVQVNLRLLEMYAQINLGLFSQTVQKPCLRCVVGGWGCSSLDRKHKCQTVIAAGTKQHLKRFVLRTGGVAETENVPQLHQSSTETIRGVVCDTDLFSPHPLCWCLQAILAHPNSRGAHFFLLFPVSYRSLPY